MDTSKIIRGVRDIVLAACELKPGVGYVYDLTRGFPLVRLGYLTEESVTGKQSEITGRDISGQTLQYGYSLEFHAKNLQIDSSMLLSLVRFLSEANTSWFLIGDDVSHEIGNLSTELIVEAVLNLKGKSVVEIVGRKYLSQIAQAQSPKLFGLGYATADKMTLAPYLFARRTNLLWDGFQDNLKLWLLPHLGNFGLVAQTTCYDASGLGHNGAILTEGDQENISWGTGGIVLRGDGMEYLDRIVVPSSTDFDSNVTAGLWQHVFTNESGTTDLSAWTSIDPFFTIGPGGSIMILNENGHFNCAQFFMSDQVEADHPVNAIQRVLPLVTTPGKTYKMLFQCGPVVNTGPTQTFRVRVLSAAGAVLSEKILRPENVAYWESYALFFTATSEATTVEFGVLRHIPVDPGWFGFGNVGLQEYVPLTHVLWVKGGTASNDDTVYLVRRGDPTDDGGYGWAFTSGEETNQNSRSFTLYMDGALARAHFGQHTLPSWENYHMLAAVLTRDGKLKTYYDGVLVETVELSYGDDFDSGSEPITIGDPNGTYVYETIGEYLIDREEWSAERVAEYFRSTRQVFGV